MFQAVLGDFILFLTLIPTRQTRHCYFHFTHEETKLIEVMGFMGSFEMVIFFEKNWQHNKKTIHVVKSQGMNKC